MKLTITAALAVLLGAAPALGQGACCMPDQSCVNVADEAECSGIGGIFLDGEDCATDPCGVGACCFMTSCNETDAFSCVAAGREFAGAGTTCLDDPCEAGVGACCFGDGSCQDTSSEACAAAGGTWLGAGTNCAAGPCVLGACCLPGQCLDTTQVECAAMGGVFEAGDACKGSACQPEECPANTHYGQARDEPDDFIAGTSELSAGFRRYDDFSGVAGPITSVTFWGLDLDHIGGNTFIECVETDPTFVISFHTDAGGQPGVEVCSFVVTATRTPTGIDYLGAELNVYEATLPGQCVLVNGWVSIEGLGDPECWFLWMSAGPGLSWCDGCLAEGQGFDLAFCVVGPTGSVFGACCDDATGGCTDGVEISDCTVPGLRFTPDTLCADLAPPCGLILGACCFDDATCSIETDEDCTDLGGTWLGADTLCEQCPCLTPCPPGGIEQEEAVCFDGYVDQFNAGCNAFPNVFSQIALGDTVCATSGIYDDGGTADFDWYEVQTVATSTELTWSVQAEFIVQAWIIDGNAGCPGTILATEAHFECTDATLTVTVGPGTYWLVVAPAAFNDLSGCGTSYVAAVSAPIACPADLDNDGTVGITDLLILLAAWGTDPGGPPDFDMDGSVGITDLLELLATWGPCP